MNTLTHQVQRPAEPQPKGSHLARTLQATSDLLSPCRQAPGRPLVFTGLQVNSGNLSMNVLHGFLSFTPNCTHFLVTVADPDGRSRGPSCDLSAPGLPAGATCTTQRNPPIQRHPDQSWVQDTGGVQGAGCRVKDKLETQFLARDAQLLGGRGSDHLCR